MAKTSRKLVFPSEVREIAMSITRERERDAFYMSIITRDENANAVCFSLLLLFSIREPPTNNADTTPLPVSFRDGWRYDAKAVAAVRGPARRRWQRLGGGHVGFFCCCYPLVASRKNTCGVCAFVSTPVSSSHDASQHFPQRPPFLRHHNLLQASP